MAETTILSVKNLTTTLDLGSSKVNVVDGLSFDLIEGKTLALVGESGCGKSMTALSLMRILPVPPALPSTGEVIFQGQNLLTISERKMRKIRGASIGMIFQDPMSALNPVYTIGDQLTEVANIHLNLYGKPAVERAIYALDEVGIPSPGERFGEYPHQLSGGMKQRVMIAMALLCEPEVLIADEPTTALDVTIQAQVLQLIHSLQEKKKMALLLITHDMGVVAEMADEVIVMYASQGVEKGTVHEIFDHKAHPYTTGLFQARPSHKRKSGSLQTIKGFVPPLYDLPSGCRFHPRCPFVLKKCHQGEVPTFPVENKSHTARCWLHDKRSNPEKLQTAEPSHGDVKHV